MTHEENRTFVGLPVRPFLYSRKQITQLLGVTEQYFHTNVAYYEGKSVHRLTQQDMKFINIAPSGLKPIWRCEEKEFVRWCKHKGIKVRDASWARKR